MALLLFVITAGFGLVDEFSLSVGTGNSCSSKSGCLGVVFVIGSGFYILNCLMSIYFFERLTFMMVVLLCQALFRLFFENFVCLKLRWVVLNEELPHSQEAIMKYLMAAVCLVCIVASLGCATTTTIEAQNPTERIQKFQEGWSADGKSYAQCFPGFRSSQLNFATDLARQDMVRILAQEKCSKDSTKFQANPLVGATKYYFFEEGLCVLMEASEPIEVHCY